MNERDPFNRAIEILNSLPAIPSVPADEHLGSIDSAIADVHSGLISIHAPNQILFANFLLAELTLMKGYIAVKSRSTERKAIGAIYLDEVLRLVKTGLNAIQFTAFVGIDSTTFYFSGEGIRTPGESREWDIKHLLSHYNGLVRDLEQLKTVRSPKRRELYLCDRIGLHQMFKIAIVIAENRY
jgi:hypothetical protein